ncbi:kinase-like domain-containing protein [Phanerochaete sordida]|uniref:Kinase-like domain-containing protein n=1 Tax=Phanerochaete sordida TaxID=48140 RepID=A0A9P3G0A5_9APHY|nr:kinase-like domain-containing protein [Phanerochaete sordida]
MSSEDLAAPDGLRSYLAGTPFASTDINALSGGLGNYTYRVRLAQPYHGHETVVVKHGKAWLPAARTFELPLYRQKYEVESLRRVRALLPEDALVTTPEIFLFDEPASVIIMEDCGADSDSLKNLLLADGALTPAAAQTIGAALGAFIVRVHAWGREQETIDFFKHNTFARSLSAQITYGRVLETVTGQAGLDTLADPPLDVPAPQLAALADVCSTVADAIRTREDGCVHGDFWTGNVIVRLAGAGAARRPARAFVVDWELAKTGVPGNDLGQFAAEVLQARTFFPACEPAAAALLPALLGAYRAAAPGMDMRETARFAVAHVGAHISTWTPRTETWRAQGRDLVRQVVLQGVQLLLQAHDQEDDLSQTMFGPLLG